MNLFFLLISRLSLFLPFDILSMVCLCVYGVFVWVQCVYVSMVCLCVFGVFVCVWLLSLYYFTLFIFLDVQIYALFSFMFGEFLATVSSKYSFCSFFAFLSSQHSQYACILMLGDIPRVSKALLNFPFCLIDILGSIHDLQVDLSFSASSSMLLRPSSDFLISAAALFKSRISLLLFSTWWDMIGKCSFNSLGMISFSS